MKPQTSEPGRRSTNGFRRQKTATLLAQRIVGEIADGELEPGTSLLPEKEMLVQYGVARGTLREALRFLEMQGVVTIKTGPGGGPFVAAPSSRHLAGIIALILQVETTPFQKVLEARVTLEPSLARRAAERSTAADRAALSRSVTVMEDNLGDADVFLRENESFHDIVARAARNQVFSLLISSLIWIIDGSVLGVEYPRETRRSVLSAHREIQTAIEDGDGDGAARAMATHMNDYVRYLDRNYPHILDARLRWDQVR